MRSLPYVIAFLVPALLLPTPSRAEDDTPAAAYEKAVAGFPKPASDRAFARAFAGEGAVIANEKEVGRFRLAARGAPLSGTPDGPVHWRLEEYLAWTIDEVAVRREATAFADNTLRPVEGALIETDEWGDTTTYAWRKTGDGYRVEMTGESRTPMERTAAEEGPSLTTMAALVLFGRLAPSETAIYETRIFDPSWDYLDAERPFVATRITVEIEGTWRGHEARIVTATWKNARLVVALHAESGDLLGLEVHEKGRPDLLLLPEAKATTETDDDLFAAPAGTPRACALRVALAFATADPDLFAEVIHWPTLKENMKDRIQGTVSDEAFRKAILEQFDARKQDPQPRKEAEAFLRGLADRIEVETKGSNEAVVTLPEEYGRMRLTVALVDGAWHLVRLPGS